MGDNHNHREMPETEEKEVENGWTRPTAAGLGVLTLTVAFAAICGALGGVILDQGNDVKCYNRADVLMESDALCGAYPPSTFALYGLVGGAILGILPAIVVVSTIFVDSPGCFGCGFLLILCVGVCATVTGAAVMGCAIEDCAKKAALAGFVGTAVGWIPFFGLLVLSVNMTSV